MSNHPINYKLIHKKKFDFLDLGKRIFSTKFRKSKDIKSFKVDKVFHNHSLLFFWNNYQLKDILVAPKKPILKKKYLSCNLKCFLNFQSA